MKNLFLSAAIVLGGLTSFASTLPITNSFVKTISIQDEYIEIKVVEVPGAITDALKKAYPDALISKAYKAKSEYRLDITVSDKVGSLFANADGPGFKNNPIKSILKIYKY
ncbi:hypothetical protein [Flavobacterium piscis]|uniref:Uncharacterized protein n=1 Tax=Flavobacterium piscis TaxID=1114874 RepID=A0ABU1Y638_9FLAO|nr:hypothetical protein [Flavobacterium piscis]MDR7209694.1 hypothetical protein [Flavobacterium piscis]